MLSFNFQVQSQLYLEFNAHPMGSKPHRHRVTYQINHFLELTLKATVKTDLHNKLLLVYLKRASKIIDGTRKERHCKC